MNSNSEIRYIIRFTGGVSNMYLIPKSNYYSNYINKHFSFNYNSACTYKSIKNAFHRINKLKFDNFNEFEIVQVRVCRNPKNLSQKFTFIGKSFNYRDVKISLILNKLKDIF
ncbi:MAG: hypothetical protein ACOC3V_03820 [bacterium]